jgi:hypothetical protein
VKRALLLGFGLLVAAAGGLTVLALEGREVAVLRTTDAGGQTRDTRVWVADDAGAAWVEAASPDRPFLRALERDPEVTLRRSALDRTCRATVLPNPDGHERIRRLLAAKYGWADCWIGLLADTTRSLAVRLDCS